MNVTLDKTGNVSGVLTISIVEEDYQAEVKKQLSTGSPPSHQGIPSRTCACIIAHEALWWSSDCRSS